MPELIYDLVIIGGGMAGCMAAVAAAERFQMEEHPGRILILDAADKPLKKIYATGNGKCNLTNQLFDRHCYYSDSGDPFQFMGEDLPAKITGFFTAAGIPVHSRNGYIYPRTDQASGVVSGILRLLRRYGIDYRCPVRVTGINIPAKSTGDNQGNKQQSEPLRIHCTSKDGKTDYLAGAVIIACGGMVHSSYGCRGDGYRIAESLGMEIIPLRPALTGLTCEDPLLKLIQGVRCQAKVSLVESDDKIKTNYELGSETGELQITEQGLSGIPVFQLSRMASGRSCTAIVDFLPEYSENELSDEIERRLAAVLPGDTIADLFTGLVHSKVASYVIRSCGLADEKKLRNISAPDGFDSCEAYLKDMLERLKFWPFKVTGTFGFSHAQVTAGGVSLKEVDSQLKAKRCDHVYLAGELLDVDGICGGYNLSFAFASGRTAGKAAAEDILRQLT
ncbi:MAG: aminoacetone oxidase family FAD-binding enzyme [Lachnospiraceae bacterium]|nr:aminoacetone oxidase family FAD-binding enzyme [Lachnospiraceae bacterium]